MLRPVARRLGSHTGLKAIVEQTYEALLGLQPATCSPSGATVAAAAGTVLEDVNLAAARISPAAGDAAAQQIGKAADRAGSRVTEVEHSQKSSMSAVGPDEPRDGNTPVSPSAPSNAVPLPDSVGDDSCTHLSSIEAAALLDLNLALLQRLVRSDCAALLAANICRALLAIVKPAGKPVSQQDTL